MDSMYFRGANDRFVEQLTALKAKTGCEFGLSLVVVLEASRVALESRKDRDGAVREKGVGALLGPLNRLRPLLCDQPLRPCIYYEPPDARRLLTLGRRRREYDHECRMIWNYITSDVVTDKWRYSAEFAVLELGTREAKWGALCRPLDDRAKSLIGLVGEDEALELLVRHVRYSMRLPPALWNRFDAHCRDVAWRLLQTGLHGAPVDRNDDTDARLLLHLSDGWILMTEDKGLHQDVSACKTKQATWVRTLDELLIDIPSGPTWAATNGAVEAD